MPEHEERWFVENALSYFCNWLPVGWSHNGKAGIINSTAYHVVVVFSGSVLYEITRKEKILKVGDYLIIPPGNRYKAEKLVNETYAMTARFELRGGKEWAKEVRVGSCLNLNHARDAADRIERFRGHNRLVCIALEEVLIHLESAGSAKQSSDALQSSVLEIKAKRGVDCGVKELAARSGMSYRNYVRCFKEVTGVTPMQFIVDQRIRYACEFLMKGYRVKEVAEKLHYSDLYFFSKQFKQQKGQSPKSWLKQDKLDF